MSTENREARDEKIENRGFDLLKDNEYYYSKRFSFVNEVAKVVTKTCLNSLESGTVNTSEIFHESRFFIRSDGVFFRVIVVGDIFPHAEPDPTIGTTGLPANLVDELVSKGITECVGEK